MSGIRLYRVPAGTFLNSNPAGTVETVATKAEFPAEEPVFQLASLSRDGKSVRIAVAGGSYCHPQMAELGT